MQLTVVMFLMCTCIGCGGLGGQTETTEGPVVYVIPPLKKDAQVVTDTTSAADSGISDTTIPRLIECIDDVDCLRLHPAVPPCSSQHCEQMQCVLTFLCDDGDSCTLDFCSRNGCVNDWDVSNPACQP